MMGSVGDSSNQGLSASVAGARPGTGSLYKSRTPWIPQVLPHEKVFPIQIGSELFRLSGASISSDAPSYFSAFFECQLKEVEQRKLDDEEAPSVRTLYIDRDPVTFRDLSRHLQGYHISPRDGAHFVKLFADAQFYQLPRLIDQLYEEAIYISIGGREFRIPREIFSSPGDSPNYFTLGYAFLFSSPKEAFPGLDREGLLRPPSILPPEIPNHSADIFADLLHVLQGYPLQIRDEEHRKQLLQDCRYYLFKGVEQKLIPYQLSYNASRGRDEILLRLEDIRQTGLSCVADPALSTNPPTNICGWVNYSRPYVDDRPVELVLEIGRECTKLHLHSMRADFLKDGKTRISRLFEVVRNKLNLPTTQPLGLLMHATNRSESPSNSGLSEDMVKVELGDAAITLDGRRLTDFASGKDNVSHNDDDDDDDENVADHNVATSIGSTHHERPRKRKRVSGNMAEETWIIRTGQWRLRVQTSKNGKAGVECVMVAVKLDAYSCERARNEQRSFLGG